MGGSKGCEDGKVAIFWIPYMIKTEYANWQNIITAE